jgi:hypothetical protein
MASEKVMRVLCVVLVFAIAATVNAVTYTGSVEYTAGSGSNQATIVIDFDFGNSFLFNYQWDGDATGWGALAAIDLAGALDVDAKDFGGWGVFVNDFDYSGGLEYDYGEGANTGWAYYVGNNEAWTLGTGVSSRWLNNGDWDSWVWTNYSADWSIAYRTPGAAPIPEPMTIVLLGLGGLLLRNGKGKEQYGSR